ncbi:hypothetical protein [Chromatium okenii]|uniref:hypothetical protein n=1 Tax=Chromatium okenii TaxID=61644 RepID=UPI001F5B168A|nr:hypothetical protein [Chromatium okenii]
MTTAAGCAVAAPQLPPAEQWLLLTAWAVIYVLIHWRVMLVERSAISSSLPVVAHCSTDN